MQQRASFIRLMIMEQKECTIHKFILARLIGLILVAFLVSKPLNGQQIFDDKDSNVSFGLQVSALFPNNLLNIRSAVIVDGDFLYGVEPVTGFSYGAVVNFRLTNKLYLLSGINLLRRDYVAYETENGVRNDVRFRTTTFEIPFMASYYVRLSESLLLNVAGGMPIHFLPSDLFVRNQNDLEALSLKLGYLKPVFSTNVGMEYRIPYSGAVYLGVVYTVAPWPLFVTRIGRRGVPFESGRFIEHVGDFFGVVARYYLP
jgi:hypothetical protein